ncbi:aldehyde oxidase 6 isoform X1 [Denticeps clupeoides]|uniref:Xanthine dehydrogenase n=1 Tax=Denticeps clupeoides TaxID=299321 RepID=A0AAY4DXE1_9TELE|nr:aldehyde oxidase isoform X1 [Denticeps clupeoides]XP_028836072.1 aldehyde oxidase isoform X1 [Denticeps clupeoides]XP_028836073.1 aldehyde oxidase isoform X1 [Denticeps clupeoides]
MAEGTRCDYLTFFVNGKKVIERIVDPETTLLSYLRGKLRLTGTKYGCGGGGCGACTVMVSRYQTQTKRITHFPANACLLPVCQLQGAAVTTVEGIGSTKTRLHPVQERIAKAHGSQCGFCTPGMVMSMYALLRNQPQPTLDDITEALAGNLCRCTGYRPIVDGCKTFCENSNCCQLNGKECCLMNGAKPVENGENDFPELFNKADLLPLDPTQELIFPPELIMMAETQVPTTQTFCGERMTWVSPVSLDEVLDLKSAHPQAPILMGNTNVGPDIKFKGVVHPVIISPTRVPELFEVTRTPQGVSIGAGSSLAAVRAELESLVKELPEEHAELYRALLLQLGSLAGPQIRSVATLGGNVVSAYPNSDLNPVLAAGNCRVLAVSKGGRREIPINRDFFVGFGKTALKPDEIVLSVFIPVSKKGEFVRAFRQAPRKENALATVNAAMRVVFSEGSSMVHEISIFHGGVGPSTVYASKTCKQITGKPWSEETLNAAYPVLLEEMCLPPSAPGGKVDFRRAVSLSFLFKFFLQMQQKLHIMGVAQQGLPENMRSGTEPLPSQLQPSYQEFQGVPVGQDSRDPVGRPLMHRSALSQATGEAMYCDDLPKTEGELFLVIVTSTKAHAKILNIDTTEALKVPGVVDVITAKDIPGKKFRTFTGITEELLAVNEVTCVGQMICAVAGDTKSYAKRGAAAVKITYEELPERVFTVEEAIQKQSFFQPQREIWRGDVSEGFRKAEHIHEGEIRLGGQEHFYMETQSMLVVPVGEEKELNVYLSTQHPAYAQESIAETLDIPSNRVSCHVKRIGGAFGGKVTKTCILASITAVAALKTERAVRLVLERGEDMLITGARHPVLGRYKVGYMNDGQIIAADIMYYTNAGNTADESLLVIEKILLHLDNAYSIPNLRGRSTACKTNLPSNTAFRGFGVPQSMLVTENMMNDVALRLGRAAEEIRDINMYKEVSLTHYKQMFDPLNLRRCWQECMEKSSYQSRRKDIDQFNQLNRWKKRGISVIPIKYGVGFAEGFLNQAAALVHIYKDGSVLVSHGGAEMGQGIHTKMQQVASRELQIPSNLIHISETSTNTVPNTCPSAASFGTDANGMAVKDACEILYNRLEPIRKKNPKGSWQAWISEAFLLKISLSATGYYRGPDCDMDWEKQEGAPYAYFTYGACCSEVEVDCLTGDYRTIRTDIVVDIGRSINPSVDIGQIEGAFVQGLGLYTMEELKFSPSGVLYTRGPGQYKIPAICDMPLKFNVYLLAGTQNPSAIYSSKGIGEPTLFLGSSVFFAIKDAVVAARRDAGMTGLFEFHSPATPERTCMACATHFARMVPESTASSVQPWAIESP